MYKPKLYWDVTKDMCFGIDLIHWINYYIKDGIF